MAGPRYWGYYDHAPLKEVKDGIKAKSKRGAIGEKWWSKRFVSLLESFDIGARLGRGRSYARKGQVISIDVQKGVVRGKVQGTRSKPYGITIELCPISEGDWEKATDSMASRAVFAAKLLSGEMPQEIEHAFADAKISLFPEEGDIKTDCTCPDWSNPCKHIAAVYYLLAEQFDEDPFLIFKLRGKTKEEIIEALRERRSSHIADDRISAAPGQVISSSYEVRPLEEFLDSFWQARGQLEFLELNPTSPKVENPILRRLGDSPFFIGKTNLTSILSNAYRVAGKAALRKALGEMDEPELSDT
jgi:uncharacterized Zn finger protein